MAQQGKAFRNEISPRNFLFRCREFEQADTQYFIKPGENKDNYERIKAFETQYLEEIRRADRKFVATNSGLTYKVVELGDLKTTVRSNRDTMLMRYRLVDMSGAVLDTTYMRADTLRIAAGELPKGVLEATKLIGKGGHIEAWVPSQLGYGADGCDSLGVKPNTILYYEMWLVDVEKR